MRSFLHKGLRKINVENMYDGKCARRVMDIDDGARFLLYRIILARSDCCTSNKIGTFRLYQYSSVSERGTVCWAHSKNSLDFRVAIPFYVFWLGFRFVFNKKKMKVCLYNWNSRELTQLGRVPHLTHIWNKRRCTIRIASVGLNNNVRERIKMFLRNFKLLFF